MKELGEYLKRTRVRNGVSLTEACEDLEFSTSQLENIDSGNVRAFKDLYDLRESIKLYAKYLGLDADKVVDEFNNFLFQNTSKISLDDIKVAQDKKKKEEDENKVKSPYTIAHKEKKSVWPLLLVLVGILLLIIIVYIIVSNINKAPTRVDELKSFIREERIVWIYQLKLQL